MAVKTSNTVLGTLLRYIPFSNLLRGGSSNPTSCHIVVTVDDVETEGIAWAAKQLPDRDIPSDTSHIYVWRPENGTQSLVTMETTRPILPSGALLCYTDTWRSEAAPQWNMVRYNPRNVSPERILTTPSGTIEGLCAGLWHIVGSLPQLGVVMHGSVGSPALDLRLTVSEHDISGYVGRRERPRERLAGKVNFLEESGNPCVTMDGTLNQWSGKSERVHHFSLTFKAFDASRLKPTLRPREYLEYPKELALEGKK